MTFASICCLLIVGEVVVRISDVEYGYAEYVLYKY